MRRILLRGLSFHALGSASVAIVGLVRSVIIARVMGPAAFGLWQGCLVALRLVGECQLGALHAVALDGPLLRAAGRAEEARSLERRALAFGCLLSIVPSVAAAVLLRWEGGRGLGLAAALLAGACLAWQVVQAAAAVLRARGRFGTLAVLQISFAAVHLAGLLLLVPGRYITGALAAWIAGAAVAVAAAAAVSREPLPLPSRPRAGDYAPLVRRGWAAWLVGLTFLLLFQVDRVLVGAILGREALGRYGILLLSGSALLFLPDVFSGVLWPLAGERYGRSGERAGSLREMAERSHRGLGPPLACLVLLGFQATDVLVRSLLPAYQDSLPPLRAYLPGVFFLCLSIPTRTLLVTVRGEREVLRSQVAVLLLTAAGQSAAALLGGGIVGVCIAGTAGGFLLLSLLLRQAAGVLGIGGGGWVRFAAEGALLAAAALAADALLSLPVVPPADAAPGARRGGAGGGRPPPPPAAPLLGKGSGRAPGVPSPPEGGAGE